MECEFCEADLEIDFDGSYYCDDCKPKEMNIIGKAIIGQSVQKLFSEGNKIITQEDIEKDIKEQAKARGRI